MAALIMPTILGSDEHKRHLNISETTIIGCKISVISLGMKEILPLVGVVGNPCYEITGYFVQGETFPFDLARPFLNPHHFQWK